MQPGEAKLHNAVSFHKIHQWQGKGDMDLNLENIINIVCLGMGRGIQTHLAKEK